MAPIYVYFIAQFSSDFASSCSACFFQIPAKQIMDSTTCCRDMLLLSTTNLLETTSSLLKCCHDQLFYSFQLLFNSHPLWLRLTLLFCQRLLYFMRARCSRKLNRMPTQVWNVSLNLSYWWSSPLNTDSPLLTKTNRWDENFFFFFYQLAVDQIDSLPPSNILNASVMFQIEGLCKSNYD